MVFDYYKYRLIELTAIKVSTDVLASFVMLWAGIKYMGAGSLWYSLTAQRYVDIVLRPALVPFVRQHSSMRHGLVSIQLQSFPSRPSVRRLDVHGHQQRSKNLVARLLKSGMVYHTFRVMVLFRICDYSASEFAVLLNKLDLAANSENTLLLCHGKMEDF